MSVEEVISRSNVKVRFKVGRTQQSGRELPKDAQSRLKFCPADVYVNNLVYLRRMRCFKLNLYLVVSPCIKVSAKEPKFAAPRLSALLKITVISS